MSVIWYGLWFTVAVGILVSVHEFGHFWVARRLGFKVLRFSVGFGKPLWKRVAKDGVEYVVAAIPLGGYVKMLDEREGPVDPAELHRSFTRRPHWQRIAVLLAGPGFNILFSILVLWGMFWASGGITHVKAVVGKVEQGSIAAHAGLRTGDEIIGLDDKVLIGQGDAVLAILDAVSGEGRAELRVRNENSAERTLTLEVSDPDQRVRLTEPSMLLKGLGFDFWRPSTPAVLQQVSPDGPAARAGLQTGDEILALNGEPVADFQDLATRINARPGQTIELRYRRNGVEGSTRVAVASEEVDGRTIGRIHVAHPASVRYPENMLIREELSPVGALGSATAEAWDLTVLQARFLWRMIVGQVSLKNLSGPIAIAEFAGESAQAGVSQFLGFLVLISLSIGFLNLVPIPMLDGGQVVYQLIEWIKGSPMSERAQLFGQQVGIVLLVMLMGLAFYNDIMARFFD